jgi:hypothetical protein
MRSKTFRGAHLVGMSVIVAVLAGACGGGSAPTEAVRQLELPQLGEHVLDLSVQSETARVKALKGVSRPYVDSIGLFSLRSGEQLEATLQVSRFTKRADTKSAKFRDSVIRQIGSTEPEQFRMGDRRVWLTTGRRQSVAVWFNDAYLYILSVRDDYAQPRTLLRTVLEVKP